MVVESIPLTHNDRLNRAANNRPTATSDFAKNRSTKYSSSISKLRFLATLDSSHDIVAQEEIRILESAHIWRLRPPRCPIDWVRTDQPTFYIVEWGLLTNKRLTGDVIPSIREQVNGSICNLLHRAPPSQRDSFHRISQIVRFR